MPSLKQLACSIEWAPAGTVFTEYGTVYGDGLVETFIAVPEKPQTFSVHIVSKGYVSDGLAVIVFVDGEYQCNRNRVNLRPLRPDAPRNLTEIDFRLRQKEKPIGDGTYIGREWRFDSHNILTDENLPDENDVTDADLNDHFSQLGNIEVLILRCMGRENQAANRSRSSSASNADSTPLENRLDCEAEPEDGAGSETNEDAAESQVQSVSKSTDGANDRAGTFGFDGGPPGPPPGGYSGWGPQNHNGQGSSAYGNGDPNMGYGRGSGPPPPPHSVPRRAAGQYGGPPRAYPGPIPKQVHWDYGDNYQAGPPPANRNYNPPRMGGMPLNNQNHPQSSGPPQSQPAAAGPPHGAWTTQDPAPQQNGSWGPPQGPPPAADPGLRYNDQAYQYPHPLYPTPPPYLPHTYPNHYGYSSWAPFGDNPPWPSHPPQFIPGPETPVFIPPYHQNHPYYAHAHGNSQPDPGGMRTPDFIRERLENMQKNEADPQASSDPAKDENNQDENQGDTNHANEGWGDNNGPGDNANDQSGNQEAWNDNGNDQGSTDNKNNANDKGWNDNDNNGNANDDGNDKWATSRNDATDNTGWDDSNADTSMGRRAAANNSGGDSNLGEPIAQRTRPMYGPHGAYYTYQSSGSGRPEVEEEPRYDVPKFIAEERGSTRQVQPGRGHLYLHRRGAPRYIDSVEEPYARFIFKYRTKSQLKNEIGLELDIEPSGDQAVQSFQQMDKQEIIEMLLRAQTALGGRIPSPPPKPAKDEEDEDPTVMKPIAVRPPKNAFLSYSLPEGRNTNDKPEASSGTEKAAKQQRRPAAAPAPASASAPAPADNKTSSWESTPAVDARQDQGRWGDGGGGSNSSAGSPPIPTYNEANASGETGEAQKAPTGGW